MQGFSGKFCISMEYKITKLQIENGGFLKKLPKMVGIRLQRSQFVRKFL